MTSIPLAAVVAALTAVTGAAGAVPSAATTNAVHETAAASVTLADFDVKKGSIWLTGTGQWMDEVRFDASFAQSAAVTVQRDGEWSVEIRDVPAGDQTIAAVITAIDGTVTQSATISFNVEQLGSQQPAPAPLTVAVSANAGGDVTVTGTGQPGDRLRFSGNFTGASATYATVDAAGSWTATFSGVPTGSRHITVWNTSFTDRAELNFQVAAETPAPTPGLTGAVSTIDGGNVTVAGTGRPGDVIRFTGNFTVSRDTVVAVAADGTWSTTFRDVPAGERWVTGNNQIFSQWVEISFTVTNTPPPAAASLSAEVISTDPSARTVTLQGEGKPGQSLRFSGNFTVSLATPVTVQADGTWTATLTNVPVGSRYV